MKTDDFYFKKLPIQVEGKQQLDITLENHADFALSNCWTYGPLTICLSQEGDKIRLCFKLFGSEVGCATILKEKPCVSWGINKGNIKIDLKVCAEFDQGRVIAEGKICYSIACVKFRQVIFNW